MRGLLLLLYAFVAGPFFLVCIYGAWRFLLHRRLPSVVFGLMPLGWLLLGAREVGLISHTDIAHQVLLALALISGWSSLLIIVHHEGQQRHPFR